MIGPPAPARLRVFGATARQVTESMLTQRVVETVTRTVYVLTAVFYLSLGVAVLLLGYLASSRSGFTTRSSNWARTTHSPCI